MWTHPLANGHIPVFLSAFDQGARDLTVADDVFLAMSSHSQMYIWFCTLLIFPRKTVLKFSLSHGSSRPYQPANGPGQLLPPHRTIIVYMHREPLPRLDNIQQTRWVSFILLSILTKRASLEKRVLCWHGPACLVPWTLSWNSGLVIRTAAIYYYYTLQIIIHNFKLSNLIFFIYHSKIPFNMEIGIEFDSNRYS